MRHLLLFLGLSISTLCSNLVWAESTDLLTIVRKSGISQNNLSLLIWADEGEKPLLDINSSAPRIPASLTKLVTASAALSIFPAEHQFITTLRSTATIENQRLNGDLYLVGDGDPGFVSESLWNLVNEFTRRGVKEIKGDLIVDDTKFDQIRYDPTRDQSRNDRAYDSPIGGMTFNWSAVNVFVKPGKKVGDPAHVFLDPENEYFKLENRIKTVSAKKTNVGFDITTDQEALNKGQGPAEKIVLTGSIGQSMDEKVYYRAVENPSYWTLYNLKSFLAQRGITVAGRFRIGKAPTSAKVLAQIKSKPLSLLVADMMKFSNNYVAEILTKNISAQQGQVPATMQAGTMALEKHLKDLDIKNFILKNPSGLSRDNRFTAEHFVKLLSQMRRNFRVYPEFLVSLPIAGVDGTLKSRMKAQDQSLSVRAKTGLLTGVAGLAGYIGVGSKTYSFAFIYNGDADHTNDAKVLFDRLATSLAD